MTPSPDLAISSSRIVTPEDVQEGAVLIKEGKIFDVVAKEKLPDDCPVEDVGDLVIMPGLVDAHVHVNEPGRTDWEGFETATRAAAAGGITTIVDMPLNSIPVTTTAEALQRKIASTKNKLWVDCGFYGGVIPDNLHHLEPLMEAGVMGFKAFMCDSGVDEFPRVTADDLRKAIPILAERGATLLAHAEVEQNHVGSGISHSYESYLLSRPNSWENEGITLLLDLCKEFRCPVHIVHLSSADLLPEIAKARAEGLPVSVETCPHYLHFSSENIRDGDTCFKCAPPIRGGENREKLWEGLERGVIDFVASDHSPCPPEMKNFEEGIFQSAWGGISSLQLILPAIWTECRKRGLTLTHLTHWLCERPARFIGMGQRKGGLRPGCDADLVCWAPDAAFTVEPSVIHHRHKLTPYENETLFGVVRKTFLQGIKVFENGQFINRPSGETLLRSHV